MLALLGAAQLPWWGAYGYTAARFDDVPTQLAFVRQFVHRAGARGEIPNEAWDAAYTALRRALRSVTSERSVDCGRRAEVLFELADFAWRERGHSSMRAFAEGAARSDGDDRAQRRAIATLLALQALEPRQPRWPVLRELVSPFPRRPPLPDRLRVERLPALAKIASTELAAEVLAEAAEPETSSVRALSVTWAQQSVAERNQAASEHVRWLLRDQRPGPDARDKLL